MILAVAVFCAILIVLAYNRWARGAYLRTLSQRERDELDRFSEQGGNWRKYRDFKRLYLDS